MRIISGTAKGTKLDTISEEITRPTLDRVKESLFSIIQNNIQDSIVFDVFSGSGALGLECLSRGGKIAYLCDKSYKAINIIKKNAEKTKLIDKTVIMQKSYTKSIEELSNIKFDLIFIDPPYKENIAVKSIKLIMENNMLKKDGILVLETDNEKRELEQLQNIPNINIINTRTYGRVTLFFINGRS